MNPLIERVARALRDQRDPACPWEDYVRDARAALLAAREPTDRMVVSALRRNPSASTGEIETMWYAMIDAALS